jgi:hypothetical protein
MKTLMIILACVGLLQTVTGQLTNETVNTALRQSDTNYAARVTHHLAIKTFLSARDKDDSRANQLISVLLSNGFAIDDFPKAYWIINMPAAPPIEPYVAKLREWGRTEEEIAMRLKRRAPRDDALRRNLIKQMTGITDEHFVDPMLALEQQAKVGPGPGPILPQAIDGERLLTDADWMTDPYRQLIASSSGKPRRFSTFPIHLNPEDDSLLKLNGQQAR